MPPWRHSWHCMGSRHAFIVWSRARHLRLLPSWRGSTGRLLVFGPPTLRGRPCVIQSPVDGVSRPGGHPSITACAYVDTRAASDGDGTCGFGGIRVLGCSRGGLQALAGQPRGGCGGVTLCDGTGRHGGTTASGRDAAIVTRRDVATAPTVVAVACRAVAGWSVAATTTAAAKGIMSAAMGIPAVAWMSGAVATASSQMASSPSRSPVALS